MSSSAEKSAAGTALEDLLIGRVGRLGRAPVLADQRLDRRPVDDVERIERAAAGIARIEGRRVDDQHLLDQHSQPVGERMAPVGAGEEARDGVDALRGPNSLLTHDRTVGGRIVARCKIVIWACETLSYTYADKKYEETRTPDE